jgi:NTP pyrophosphatase (non-canonical NTP hydrolase)
MTEQPTALRLADALETLWLANLLSSETRDEAAAELRRLSAVNQELGAALRRLISYCNTLENRLMEADGEHPALQEAKEAYAKVEEK